MKKRLFQGDGPLASAAPYGDRVKVRDLPTLPEMTRYSTEAELDQEAIWVPQLGRYMTQGSGRQRHIAGSDKVRGSSRGSRAHRAFSGELGGHIPELGRLRAQRTPRPTHAMTEIWKADAEQMTRLDAANANNSRPTLTTTRSVGVEGRAVFEPSATDLRAAAEATFAARRGTRSNATSDYLSLDEITGGRSLPNPAGMVLGEDANTNSFRDLAPHIPNTHYRPAREYDDKPKLYERNNTYAESQPPPEQYKPRLSNKQSVTQGARRLQVDYGGAEVAYATETSVQLHQGRPLMRAPTQTLDHESADTLNQPSVQLRGSSFLPRTNLELDVGDVANTTHATVQLRGDYHLPRADPPAWDVGDIGMDVQQSVQLTKGREPMLQQLVSNVEYTGENTHAQVKLQNHDLMRAPSAMQEMDIGTNHQQMVHLSQNRGPRTQRLMHDDTDEPAQWNVQQAHLTPDTTRHVWRPEDYTSGAESTIRPGLVEELPEKILRGEQRLWTRESGVVETNVVRMHDAGVHPLQSSKKMNRMGPHPLDSFIRHG